MPMSIFLVLPVHRRHGGQHAGGGREVRDHRDLREAAVERVERRARVEAEPAEPEDQDAEAEQRHRVARDGARLAVLAELAAAGAEQQQRGQRAGGAHQVDHRRAGEVLHADGRGQPAAAEDPVRADRIDQRREDDRVEDVDAELDALERRAPHDRQRDGAEDELEEPERLDGDRAVLQVDQREVRTGVRTGQEETVGADDRVALAEGERHADRPEHQRGDREVHQDLGDHRAGVLAAREADLQEGEARLHEHDQDARDQRPQRVQADGLRELALVGQVERRAVGERCRGHYQYRCQRSERRQGQTSTTHPLPPHRGTEAMVGRAGRSSLSRVSKIHLGGFAIRSSRGRPTPQTAVFPTRGRRPTRFS
jgi:hypothetical protein